jgi:integrase-like protein
MHLVLNRRPLARPEPTCFSSRSGFDTFVHEYNNERPHEALGQRTPASLYVRSPRAYPTELPALEYPMHDHAIRVFGNGDLWLTRGHVFFLSAVLAGHFVAVAR